MAIKPRIKPLVGTGVVNRLFGGGEGQEPSSITEVPWDRAGRRRDRADYDGERVRAVLMHPDRHEIVDVDPTTLNATQPSITRAGVSHYLSGDYERTGKTFADQGNAGNRHPIVYNREGTNMLLSGHHRATAALLRGEQFKAVLVNGPWGAPR